VFGKAVRDYMPRRRGETVDVYYARVDAWVQFVIRVWCRDCDGKMWRIVLREPYKSVLDAFERFWRIRGETLMSGCERLIEDAWAQEAAGVASVRERKRGESNPLLPTWVPWEHPVKRISVDWEDEDAI
jgi:hypothetical protein